MKLNCIHCNGQLEILPKQLGTELPCPHCRHPIQLPEAEDLGYDRAEDGFSFADWLRGSLSTFVSLSVHIALMLIAAFITCDYRGGDGEGEEVMIGELPFEILSESPEQEFDLKDVEADSEETAELDETLEIVNPTDASDSDISVEVNLSQFIPSGASGGGSVEIGNAGSGGGALGEGASFMGLSAKGTRFCIIADCSGSMSGAKLEYVKEEVLETLTSMRKGGRFQLIFFNSQSVPFPEMGWRHPKKDRSKVENWLASLYGGGGTNPMPAFQLAFGLSPKPDAIFFMTDGLFDSNVVDDVAALNNRGGRKVSINTISFMDQSSEQMMKRIANDSNGRYRHVAGF